LCRLITRRNDQVNAKEVIADIWVQGRQGVAALVFRFLERASQGGCKRTTFVVQRGGGSGTGFIDQLCPNPLGFENELHGFANRTLTTEGFGNVVRGLLNFGDRIAHRNGKPGAAQ